MTTVKDYLIANKTELDKFTRTIEKVHGKSHPELGEVRQLFLTIQEKAEAEIFEQADLDTEMLRLKTITADYTPPADACQAYQKTYGMLKEMDLAYQG